MQEKQKRDTITELLLDNGTRIRGDEVIMSELVRFCQDLFAKDHYNTHIQPTALHSLLHMVRPVLSPKSLRAENERLPRKN